MLNRYFKASDDWFLLSALRVNLKKLAIIPQFSQCNLNDDTIDEEQLARIFKTKSISWWIDSIHKAGANHQLLVVRRHTLSKVLKKELSSTNPLFSYANHEGFGKAIYPQPPLSSSKCQLATISPAPYPGSATKSYLHKLGFDPAPHTPNIPQYSKNDVTIWERLLWIIRQIKWISVIFYRNRGLRDFK